MSKIAVIKTGGKQYKVKENDVLKIEKLNVEEGKDVSFDQVLLVADENGSSATVGTPLVEKAKVSATVVEQGRAEKINVIKYKAKTRYAKKYGHRQPYTKVKITKIAA